MIKYIIYRLIEILIVGSIILFINTNIEILGTKGNQDMLCLLFLLLFMILEIIIKIIFKSRKTNT